MFLRRHLRAGAALVPALLALTLLAHPDTSAADKNPGTRTFHPPYNLVDLGLLGGRHSYATRLNDSGVVVGYIEAGTEQSVEFKAFRWENGTGTLLGTLGGRHSVPHGINSAGQIVGSSSTATGNDGFLWQNGTISPLNLGGSAAALAINDNGNIAGIATIGNASHAVFRNNVETRDLGVLPGDSFSASQDLNNIDEVVGYSGASGKPLRAFIYRNNQLTALGGTDRTLAFAVNNSGVVVGEVGDPNVAHVAFRWENGTYTSLGTLGGTHSSAYGINNAGQIVGRSRFNPTLTERHGFLWQNGTMSDLNNLIPANSGFVLEVADDINNRGQIVGTMLDSNGFRHAFLLTHADLSAELAGDSSEIAAGVPLSYLFRVRNNGPAAATNVKATLNLPPGTTFNAAGSTANIVLNGSTLSFQQGALAVGGSIDLRISLTHSIPGPVELTGQVTGDQGDAVPPNDRATTTTTVLARRADLAVTKTASPDPAVLGGEITYTITVKNNGPDTATGVTVTDTLPAGVTFQPAQSTPGITVSGSTLTFTAAELAAGNTATVTVVVTPAAVGNYPNSVAVAANEGDPVPGNNTASVTTAVVAPSADVAVTKTTSTPNVQPGANAVFTITVTNRGPGTANSVSLTDTLPAGVTFLPEQSTTGATLDGSTVRYAPGGLAANASASFTVTGRTSASGSLTNRAAVTTTSTDPVSDNNTATATVNVGDPPPQITTFAIRPARIKGRKKATMILKLDRAAPAGGLQITFTSSNPAVVPNPAPVTIPAGKKNPTRAPKVATKRPTETTEVFITAQALSGAISKVASLTVLR